MSNEIIKAEAKTTNRLLLTPEQLELVEQMAAMNYTAEYCAIYLDVDVEAFQDEIKQHDSDIYIHYQRGKLISSFEINQKLDQNARAGNITAIQQLEKLKAKTNMENWKEKLFG